MNLYKFTIIILLAIQFNSSAQINPGAKQIALSHSSVALANDVFAIFNNPSGIAQQNWREIGIYYSPSPFGISKLANGAAVYHEPTNIGSFAIAFTTYGFELYRESNFLLSYAYNLSNKFFFGVTAKYHNLKIERYGTDNALSFSISSLAYLTNNWRIGFMIDNVTRSSYGNEKDQIPVVMELGTSYDLLETVSLNASLQKELDRNASIRFGIDYEIVRYINLRLGAMNEPSSFSAGIGINYSLFEIDYAVFNHQDLGFTHQFQVIIQFGDDISRSRRIRNYLGIN
ncbi:hypothetical protein MNBD_IGNAVI01-3191 [hydrothermal vent metagenome]|uniref:Type IX secretion system membrane protein PorP/SprF n=1 Tax=hydrothermal vent metagenome TaxID=652676 RepID=A0A3B1DC82_9ZZZZ